MKERVTTIGSIGNYYGALSVKSRDGKYWWSIENHDGHQWEEIPESLYRELMAFEAHGLTREPQP